MEATRSNSLGSVATEIGAKSRKFVREGLGQNHSSGFHAGGMDEEATLHHDGRNVIARSHEVNFGGDLKRFGQFLGRRRVILSTDDKVAFLRFAGKSGQGLQDEIQSFELIVRGNEEEEGCFRR